MSEPWRLKMLMDHDTWWPEFYPSSGPTEIGTWYPDSDGRRAARDVAGGLLEALGDFEWELDPMDGVTYCPCCGSDGNSGRHVEGCSLGELLAKARGEASDG